VAFFFMDYQDLQLFRLDSAQRLVTFTEDTTNYGAEFELLAAPADGLELGLNAAWLKAEVDGGPNDGAQLPRAPEYSFGGFAQYSWAVTGGELSLRADFKWTDNYRTEIAYNTGSPASDAANARITEVESFALLDARAAYLLESHNLEFSVWGKNLSDETYPLHIIPFPRQRFLDLRSAADLRGVGELEVAIGHRAVGCGRPVPARRRRSS
jgi:iron complex outermembrane receptor protein